MTEEQILELAKTCGFVVQDRWSAGNDDVYYECHECELLKFALLIHENGYNKGYNEGYGEGRYDGYESAKESTEWIR
tara:strand:- start:214 stop:444 length:231 start_codon:yes stop_codon:yes gene_type:complete